MNESSIGNLVTSKEKVEIRRKHKIIYRKSKGRLIQKSCGILNKSVYKDYRTANESIGNQSQLVCVKDINSFLSKNRELAKALEESRSQVKEFEKQKVSYQSECIGMREKLSLYQKSILKCTCSKASQDVGNNLILANLEDSMKQSLSILNNYISSVVIQAVNFDRGYLEDDSMLPNNDNMFYLKEKLFHKHTSKEKHTQTDIIHTQNMKTQCDGVLTKNKKLQVRMEKYDVKLESKNIFCQRTHADDEVEDVKDCMSKEIQCCLLANESTVEKTRCIDQGIQCVLDNFVECNEEDVGKKRKQNMRKPLMPITIHNERKKPTSILKTATQSTKTAPVKSSFKIYEDYPSENRENWCPVSNKGEDIIKKVQIYSPAMVHFFENSADEHPRSRKCRNNIDTYKEPALNRKLTRNDPMVDNQFYNSPYQKVKKPRRKKTMRRSKINKLNITLEDVIQAVMEESFKAKNILI